MKKLIEFDWRTFEEKEFDYMMEDRDATIYGIIAVTESDGVNKESYLVDIGYETMAEYGNRGVYICVFHSNDGYHGKVVGESRKIKTAKNYKRFCRRVEDIVCQLIKSV